jgi:Protein of unknown function (DUF2934)
MINKASPSRVKTSATSDTNAAKASGTDERGRNAIKQHSSTQTSMTQEERHERISVAAYRLAEGRHFAPGGELEDWLRAEAEINGVPSASSGAK